MQSPGPQAATPEVDAASNASACVKKARTAASDWGRTPLGNRLRILRTLRRQLGDNPLALATTAQLPWRTSTSETLTAEVLPLLDACRFLEEEAPSILAPQHLGAQKRPFWLFGSRPEIHRDPLGVVLIIGPSNYPILLAGVQALQALVAGNTVVIKPGRGAARAMLFLRDALLRAGLPENVLHILSEEVEEARTALSSGVDKVVLTGSLSTGKSVQRDLVESVTPLVAELSGCDAVIVQKDADLARTARALAFGMTLNSGYTCIAPRRLYIVQERAAELELALIEQLKARPPIALTPDTHHRLIRWLEEASESGGRIAFGDPRTTTNYRSTLLTDCPEEALFSLADLPVPVAAILPISDEEEALDRIADCPYRLGVSIFGPPQSAASLARRTAAGVVVINDMIVPTADPRVPFGGRGASGFGVTRGAEGLLEFTAIKSVIARSGSFRPHFDPVGEADTPLFEAFVQTAHGSSFVRRFRAFFRLMQAGKQRSQRQKRSQREES